MANGHRELMAKTPHGVFKRKTAANYQFVNVWNSPRAKAVFDAAMAGGKRNSYGSAAKCVKDHGHVVTWHRTKAAADKGAQAGWGEDGSSLAGTYSVEGAGA